MPAPPDLPALPPIHPPTRRKAFAHPGRFAIYAVGLTLVVALGAIAIASSDTSPVNQQPSSVVKGVSPAPDSDVPPQTAIQVSFAVGYEGSLRVCEPSQCIDIPDDQVDRPSGLYQATYQPGLQADSAVSRWQPGDITVYVSYYKVGDPNTILGSYQWEFTSTS